MENVTPYGGVWIEMDTLPLIRIRFLSRLMGACGLKYHN